MRDGIEDYEYLVILKREIAQARTANSHSDILAEALLTIPNNIAKNADEYTTDPEVIEKQRSRIATMIERLKPQSH